MLSRDAGPFFGSQIQYCIRLYLYISSMDICHLSLAVKTNYSCIFSAVSLFFFSSIWTPWFSRGSAVFLASFLILTHLLNNLLLLVLGLLIFLAFTFFPDILLCHEVTFYFILSNFWLSPPHYRHWKIQTLLLLLVFCMCWGMLANVTQICLMLQ